MSKKAHSVAYNAFADNTSIVNRLAVVASQIYKILGKFPKIRTNKNLCLAVQGRRSWCQWKAHKQLPVSY